MGSNGGASTNLLKMLWNMRHILKVWSIGKEERGEYARLLKQLRKVRVEFWDLGLRKPDALAYQYPFLMDHCERENRSIIKAILAHLSDTVDTLIRFEWDDSEIGKFPLLLKPEKYPGAVRGETRGDALVESLYRHEALLNKLLKKRPFFDIERRLSLANKRAAGIHPD
jgi:hypothetical protein